MGTISDKLTYLNTTKTMLRDSLNKFGSNILTTDTFRSYDTKLNNIYDKLPKVTQSGAGFTLENVQNGLLDDFKMTGVNLEQDTTTGKNLWGGFQNSFSKTNADIDFVTNKDGTIKANGTANGTAAYSMYGSEATNNGFLKTLPAGNYVISGATPDVRLNVVKPDGTGIVSTGSSLYATFTLNEETQVFIRLQIVENTIVNNVIIKPMLESGTTATNYEQYTGGIPSPNPDYPQEIKVVEGRQVITDKGKNLFDKNNANILTGFLADGGTFNSTTGYKTLYISCNNSSTYTIQKTSGSFFRVAEFENIPANGDNWITRTKDDNANVITFTTTTGNYLAVTYFKSSDTVTEQEMLNSIQIEEGSSSTNFEPYYNPVSYNIDLQLANIQLAKIPNTDYKNRIYKNNGNWYFEENVKKVVLDGSDDEVWTTFKNAIILNGLWSGNQITMCDSFKETTNGLWVSDSDDYRGMCSSLNTAGQFRCMPLNDMTLSEFKTWLSVHNMTIWYPLDNPVTTQITDTTLINQLEAISVHTGTNIIELSSDNNMTPQIEITRLKELERLT